MHPAEKLEIPETTLVVVTVPVYGGKVAPLALERMKCIHTSGAPVVLAVVYGNRAYEKALAELDAFISERGFKVIAGATFVGEHSYSTDKNPIAVGRPDADDLRFAENFGQKYVLRLKLPLVWIGCILLMLIVFNVLIRHFSRYSAFCEKW